jgi:hypothetical protein
MGSSAPIKIVTKPAETGFKDCCVHFFNLKSIWYDVFLVMLVIMAIMVIMVNL